MALGPTRGSEKRRTKKSHKGLCFGLVALCVVAAGIGYFLLSQDTATKKPEVTRPQTRAIAEMRPKASHMAKTAPTNNPSVSRPDEKKLWLGMEVREHRVATNDSLIVETFVTVDGKTHKYYHDEREKILPSAADQMLALMTASDDGFGAPPLPSVPNFEDAFGKALRTEITISESDSPEVKAIKERVIAARKELLGMMAQGVNANDVVKEYKKAQEDNATIRFDAAKGVRELLDAGDIESAKELCAKYNEVLVRANIMPIEIPEEYLNKETPK